LAFYGNKKLSPASKIFIVAIGKLGKFIRIMIIVETTVILEAFSTKISIIFKNFFE
jgi:hypothetical protein